MSLSSAINELKTEIRESGIKPENGVGTELFLMTSTLVPLVNVDLLVTNSKKEILLSWRDDKHCGAGWHVPGGCIRLKETFADCIQRTALKELDSEVKFDKDPIKVFEIIWNKHRNGLEDQNERAHAITIVYKCFLSDSFEITPKPDGTPGQLKWFSALPDNLLDIQECYHRSWKEISDKLWRDRNNG